MGDRGIVFHSIFNPSDTIELAQAIRFVDRGYTQMGPGLMEKLIASTIDAPKSEPEPDPIDLCQLTPREREVLAAIALGQTNREIAQQLYITEGTVKTHVTHLLTRLNLRNRAQLAIYAHSVFPV